MKQRALPFLVLATAATAAPCAAQRRVEPVSAARVQAAALPAPSAATTLFPAEHARARRASASHALVGMLGGAVLGAGAGYLTSQVAWSDWDKSSNSEFKSRRLSFTLGGGAVGALGGLILGGRSSGGAAVPTGMPARPMVNRASVITEDEVRASTAVNVFQLVQALRPNWLHRDGGSGRTKTPEPEDTTFAVLSTSDDPGVRVYLERGLVGGIFSLREIAVNDVTSLEFLDTAAATYRLGQGNSAGVIVVHTGRAR
jgi:hypothetical protein